jgi:hypothetical protein
MKSLAAHILGCFRRTASCKAPPCTSLSDLSTYGNKLIAGGEKKNTPEEEEDFQHYFPFQVSLQNYVALGNDGDFHGQFSGEIPDCYPLQQ